ncbi:hypothetical protein DXG01_017110 [Tephrocybe rancida]|nr:hypothetical protein DXG01_017110 [Tephrocybe rancida]
MIDTIGCHAISTPSPFATFRVENVSFLMLCGLLGGELHDRLQLPIFRQLKTLALVDCLVSKRDVELISGYQPVEELVVIDTNDKAIWFQNPAIPRNGLPWPALRSVTSHSRMGSYEAMAEVLAAFKRNCESEPSLVLRTGFDGHRDSFPSFDERKFTIEEVKNLLPHIRVEGVNRETAMLHLKREGKLQR